MMLAMRLAQQHVPPATLLLVAVNALVYFNPPIPGIDFGWAQDSCLNGPAIVERLQFPRIWTSAMFHLSEMHLYFNMTSLVLKGQLLENKLGPERFLMNVFVLATLQSLIYIAVVWVLMVGFGMPEFYDQCAAGFSGVLFALKVLVHKMDPTDNAPVWFMAFRLVVSSNWVYWVELVAIQLIVPHVSFVGHFSGILAGLLFWHGVDLAVTVGHAINPPPPPRRYNDTAGQLGGRAAPAASRRAPQQAPALTASPAPMWEQPSDTESDVEFTGEFALPPPEPVVMMPEVSVDELREARLARFGRKPIRNEGGKAGLRARPVVKEPATADAPPRFTGGGKLGGN